MPDADPPATGLFASLRQLLGTGIEIAQVRLQLLGTDLEQEKFRVFGALLMAGVGLMLVTVGTVLLCGLILLLFAEGYRLAALAVLTVAFLGGGILVLRAGASRLQNPAGVFEATLNELARDRKNLQDTE